MKRFEWTFMDEVELTFPLLIFPGYRLTMQIKCFVFGVRRFITSGFLFSLSLGYMICGFMRLEPERVARTNDSNLIYSITHFLFSSPLRCDFYNRF